MKPGVAKRQLGDLNRTISAYHTEYGLFKDAAPTHVAPLPLGEIGVSGTRRSL